MFPPSHADLLGVPLHAILTTEMPDGRLQSTVVWFGRDGDDLLVNTMREFQKARNLRSRPRATLLVAAPDGRWIEVRATVTFQDAGAREHLDVRCSPRSRRGFATVRRPTRPGSSSTGTTCW